MTPEHLAEAEGRAAFLKDRPCPYAFGQPEHDAWWRGWEESAGDYLDGVLGNAWHLDEGVGDDSH